MNASVTDRLIGTAGFCASCAAFAVVVPQHRHRLMHRRDEPGQIYRRHAIVGDISRHDARNDVHVTAESSTIVKAAPFNRMMQRLVTQNKRNQGGGQIQKQLKNNARLQMSNFPRTIDDRALSFVR